MISVGPQHGRYVVHLHLAAPKHNSQCNDCNKSPPASRYSHSRQSQSDNTVKLTTLYCRGIKEQKVTHPCF